MNIELTSSIIALAAGMAIGVFFYGGLWLTVEKLPLLKRPYLWMSLSSVLRIGFAMLCLYLLFHNQWERLIIALVGIIAIRSVFLYCYRPKITSIHQHPSRKLP